MATDQSVQITNTTKADFDLIVTELADFWGESPPAHLHHCSLIHQFGDSAFVAKEGDKIVAYLFGFLAQNGPSSYVHLIAVRESHKGRGLGTKLYERFTEFARSRGAREVRAQTTPNNLRSIAFHKSIGMELLGEPDERGIPVMRDQGGPGKDRVVFRKDV